MPINRRSQSRRSYLERAGQAGAQQDLKKRLAVSRPTELQELKSEAKNKRGRKKKR